EPMVLVPTA
ncbi:hypothetical protein ECEC1737_4632, partial [Escherichia coli EC1737]